MKIVLVLAGGDRIDIDGVVSIRPVKGVVGDPDYTLEYESHINNTVAVGQFRPSNFLLFYTERTE